MVLINGVKINNNKQTQNIESTKKPSINEVLEKMQINYNNLNYKNNQQTVDTLSSEDKKQPVNNDSSILTTLLPLILNNNSNTEILKSQQNELLHTLIKNLNNPLLEKIFDLLPKLNKNKTVKKVEKEENKKNETKIDSFVKTVEYDNN